MRTVTIDTIEMVEVATLGQGVTAENENATTETSISVIIIAEVSTINGNAMEISETTKTSKVSSPKIDTRSQRNMNLTKNLRF